MKIYSLKKMLKPRNIAPLLDQAQKAAGPDLALALVGDDDVVLHATAQPPSPPSNQLAFPLSVSEQPAGRLLIWQRSEALLETGNRFMADFGKSLALLIQETISREYARRCMTDETLEQYREVALLQRMALELNQSLKIQDVTRALLHECAGGAGAAEMGMVFSRNPATGLFEALDSFGPVDAVALARITQSLLFREIAHGHKGEIINQLVADHRWQGEVAGLTSLLCIPLHSSGDWSGALVLTATRDTASFAAADLKRIAAIASVAATAMANAHHFEAVQQMLEAMIQSMAMAIDSRDPCTSGHSRRVAAYTLRFAEMIHRDQAVFTDQAFAPPQQQELFYAALLHDVGKIGVREEVLTKSERLPKGRLEIIFLKMALWGALTGLSWKDDYDRIQMVNTANVIDAEDIGLVERLSQSMVQIGRDQQPLLTPDERIRLLIPRGNLMPDEWDEIQRHPAESCRILESIPFPPHLKNVLMIVRQHHEKLNGKGYPDGIYGEEIIFPSRMIAIVDVYDALTAKDRPYKKAIPRDKALRILREEGAAGHFDQTLVDFFCRHIHDIIGEE